MSEAAGRRRIVTLTPVAVERDSRTFKQAASMARLGHESVVIEGSPSSLPASELPFELRSPAAPSRAEASPQDGETPERWIDRLLPGRLARAIRTLLEPPYYVIALLLENGLRTARRTPDADLYYLHSFRQFPAVWLRSRRTRTPFVYDAHDFYLATYEELPDTPSRRAINRFSAALEGACARRAAEVVTVSEGVAGLFEQRFGRRPLVVRNAHDARIAAPRGPGLREALGLGGSDFLIVELGQAKRGSAVAEAIEAVAGLDDRVHLAFVGAGMERHRDLVAAVGALGRVHLLPPVPPPSIVPFVESADLAALPYYPLTDNYLHALPNGFFLSVAAGLPMLYPQGLPEVRALAEQHGLGLPIDPRDPASLAAAVESLLESPELLERLRTAAGKAREILGWEREEQVLEALVKRVLTT